MPEPTGPEPTGVDALDLPLSGGLPTGNSLLVQGAPGTGKTILGMQFLQAGIARGQPGLFVSFEEHPQRLMRDARALGWDFEASARARRLLVVFTSPEAFLSELGADGYGRMIREYGLRRAVVDGLTPLGGTQDAGEPARVRSARVVNALRGAGALVLMTREAETRGLPAVAPEEYLADTVVQLDYARRGDDSGGGRVRRLEVLKSRGAAHSPVPHPFVIAEGGLSLSPGPPPRA